MENIDKIKELLKNDNNLLDSFNNLINASRERNEIYIYCFKRERLNGKINYIPLITILDNEKSIMACNDVKILQEDYKQEILKYELYGLPLIIVEVPFHIYVELSINIEKTLNNQKLNSIEEIIRKIKTEALFNNFNLISEDLPQYIKSLIIKENQYCKCLDENLNIVQCGNYKPLTSYLSKNDV